MGLDPSSLWFCCASWPLFRFKTRLRFLLLITSCLPTPEWQLGLPFSRLLGHLGSPPGSQRVKIQQKQTILNHFKIGPRASEASSGRPKARPGAPFRFCARPRGVLPGLGNFGWHPPQHHVGARGKPKSCSGASQGAQKAAQGRPGTVQGPSLASKDLPGPPPEPICSSGAAQSAPAAQIF